MGKASEMRKAALIVCVQAIVVNSDFAHAGSIDISGDYWYGRLAANVSTGSPTLEDGYVLVDGSSVEISYAQSSGFSETKTWSIDGLDLTPDGWVVSDMTDEDGVSHRHIFAANTNAFLAVSRTPNTANDVGITLQVRKAFGLADLDFIGEYEFFELRIRASGESVWALRGTYTAAADHSFDGSYEDSFGNVVSHSGFWALDAEEARADVTFTGGGGGNVGIGEGGLHMGVDIDPSDDDLGLTFLMKKTAAVTAEELVGHYLLQEFLTNGDGEDARTAWGTLDMYADGTFAVGVTDSDGHTASPVSGDWTIQGGRGIRFVSDDGEHVLETPVSVDHNMFVMLDMDPNAVIGISFAVRSILEPTIPGDTNDNNIVDGSDYENLLVQFGAVPGMESADFNDDGRVDLAAFVILRENFGFGVTLAPEVESVTTTPEPATLTLVALASLATIRRRQTPVTEAAQ